MLKPKDSCLRLAPKHWFLGWFISGFIKLMKYFARSLALLSALLSSAAYSQNPQKPNVILILADDMTRGDLASLNGGASRTPTLDRLAGESINFTNAYSASCVCAPARAAMLTGRYPHRTGVVTLNQYDYPKLTRLRHDERTIAEHLRDAGYKTGLIGKWHCGIGDGFGPTNHGFDEFEGFVGAKGNGYFKYRLILGERHLEVDDGYLTDDLSNRAIEFVRRHHEQPFFLHLAHYAPHRPLQAPEEVVQRYVAKGLNENTATIYAMIEIMDRGIGELLQTLDDLSIADNTVVIFASDNGPDPVTGARFNPNVRGMKYEVYEGGIRVPMMVRWPGKFQPRTAEDVVQFIDLFPTISEICGIAQQTPGAPKLDGQSFLDVLQGKSRKTSRYHWQWNRGEPNYTHNAAVREGPWKLVRPFVTRSVNPPDSKQPARLFHLESDGNESVDVAEQYPERARRMDQEISRWAEQVEQARLRKRLIQPKTQD
ncbi:sulfatase-like hydrolase/transferase [Roseiconus lacunae]|uniref:sulfatase-like hydrolase/transferase n=2 Tax=Roseiconus lacunae TaxID=2605694 RepID=UPI0011F20761|nr:sulfatase-like hydrolase/transferase [Roseiconus lacunae]